MTSLSDVPRERLLRERAEPRLTKVLDPAEPIEVQIAAIKLVAYLGTEQGRAALRGFSENRRLDPSVREALREAVTVR